MATHQSKDQKETVGRVMHEFKHGELKTSRGRKVKNPKQAIAIGLSEAGASKYESPAQESSEFTTVPRLANGAAKPQRIRQKARTGGRDQSFTPRPSGGTSKVGRK